jgi:hypothetical protein
MEALAIVLLAVIWLASVIYREDRLHRRWIAYYDAIRAGWEKGMDARHIRPPEAEEEELIEVVQAAPPRPNLQQWRSRPPSGGI